MKTGNASSLLEFRERVEHPVLGGACGLRRLSLVSLLPGRRSFAS